MELRTAAIAGAATQRRHEGEACRRRPGGQRAPSIFERWQALIVADRQGEDRAYDTFIRELAAWLTRYYRRRIHDGSAAEDAVQETLLAVLHKRTTYSTDEPLGPWIMTIAHHKWVDTVRRRVRATLVPLDEDLAVADHGGAVRSAIIVEDALSALRSGQREAIVCRLIDGFSVADAAKRTGQSESLVKVNVHRGLKRMAAALGGPVA